MIIQTPVTTDLGLGTDRRVIEPRDSNVTVPPTIFPVLSPNIPLAANPSSNVAAQSSFGIEYVNSKNNAGAVDDLICTLGKGYWQLQINYSDNLVMATGIGIGQRYRWKLSNGPATFPLAERALVSGTLQMAYINLPKLLVREDMQVRIDFPATAVGDTIIIWACIIAIKFL